MCYLAATHMLPGYKKNNLKVMLFNIPRRLKATDAEFDQQLVLDLGTASSFAGTLPNIDRSKG